MSVKSLFLSFVTTAAVLLSPVAVAGPANAAPATSSNVSTGTTVLAGNYGKLICSGNGVMCLQRITPVDDSGTAYVSFWADKITWTGWFELWRNGSYVTKSNTKKWEAGINSWLPNPLASGGGWSVRAKQNASSQIAEISFGV